MGNGPSERTTVHRLPERGKYDVRTVKAILDEGILCHVGFVADDQPYVMPMGYGRDGDSLLLHGSVASRLLRNLAQGVPVCVTVTLLDGLVLARSAFHHSVNYRSVVILGTAVPVDDPAEKLRALQVLTDHLVPGRTADARQPNDREVALTCVLRVPLDEASAKIRVGPPKDDEEDHALPVWAGVIPFAPAAGPPVPAPGLAAGIDPPPYATGYRRPVD